MHQCQQTNNPERQTPFHTINKNFRGNKSRSFSLFVPLSPPPPPRPFLSPPPSPFLTQPQPRIKVKVTRTGKKKMLKEYFGEAYQHTRFERNQSVNLRSQASVEIVEVFCFFLSFLRRVISIEYWQTTMMFVGWLPNIPATCECISGTDLHRQVYALPHRDRSCRSNFPSHPVTVY